MEDEKRIKGSGSVSFNKNRAEDPFQARIKINGKRKTLGFYPTREAANQALDVACGVKAKEEIVRIQHQGLFLRELKEPFFKWLKEQSFKPDGEKAHWEYLMLAPSLKGPVTGLELRDLDDALEFISKQPMRKNNQLPTWFQVRNVRTTMCRIGLFLYKSGHWKANFASARGGKGGYCGISMPRGMSDDEREKHPCLTRESVERIAESSCLEDWQKNMMLFSIYSGLRVSEQWQLTPDSFIKDEDGNMWCHVKRTKETTGKKAREKTFLMIPRARAIAEAQIKIATERRWPFLWVNEKGAQRAGQPKQFRDWLARIGGIETQDEHGRKNPPGKRMTWHSFGRSTLASALALGWWGEKLPERAAQKLIGHASPQMTAHYSRASVVQLVGDAFERKRKPGRLLGKGAKVRRRLRPRSAVRMERAA